MFGHHDDDDKEHTHDNADAAPEGADQAAAPQNEEAGQPEEPASLAAADAPDAGVVHSGQPTDPAADSQAGGDDQAWQHPGAPLADSKEPISDVISPAGFPKRPTYQYAKGAPDLGTPGDAPVSEDPANRELNDVKEHALEELAPLLDKLDLPPEEKFRAIMMILQANDDKSMVKAAYDAAHAIEDEEIRAQALFTIVNEVDYFTHQDNTPN